MIEGATEPKAVTTSTKSTGSMIMDFVKSYGLYIAGAYVVYKVLKKKR